MGNGEGDFKGVSLCHPTGVDDCRRVLAYDDNESECKLSGHSAPKESRMVAGLRPRSAGQNGEGNRYEVEVVQVV